MVQITPVSWVRSLAWEHPNALGKAKKKERGRAGEREREVAYLINEGKDGAKWILGTLEDHV